ncbi:hypothetical protein LTR10_017692 [Elasticomyces elasticus]|uniref:Thiol-specific monooxygenase n=1 Tax=Exophiala sideris TaxID=1016849 RepID=A0ABR0JBI2_9EURO|nr:hypothetical protein LTR10_017692 [Elasticomyces elasticus]KAK5031059.1 hypothetical protein LTS07_004794 [Exophiala sideris]KAK5038781.1 hypothetical protein LTR13_003812 [Exophiala sideris]KAK5060664.1 hypothetical protein LTR69_005263 [Exophiala sideris]KAK5183577.1 hypothetical protein LTR44_003859 [Eurotiomycetes sp. CCFEE 6388]
MVQKCSRVAVLGAGPAGAIAADALAKEGVFDKIRVFERKAVAGGTWVYASEHSPKIPSLRALLEHKADQPVLKPSSFPTETNTSELINSLQLRYSDTGIHEYLHSNLPPQTMCFTQEPIPEILSERTLAQYGSNAPFRHREVIRGWVEDIFVRGGTDKLIEFNTTVECAEKKGDEWVLTLRKSTPGGKKNSWWQEVFDALVVATGHFSLPYVPEILGLAVYDEKYPGRIRHSKHFRSVDEFNGKKVIIVGGSVSAFDALHEIRLVAQHPVISSLKEPIPAFGWNAFTHPHVAIKPPIARFHPNGKIEFWDGSSVDHVDVVLFATGYDFSFPFLRDVNTRIQNRRIQGLYQHVFDIEDPTVAFIGMVSGGLTFRVFEWQAVAVARHLAGRATLPIRQLMRKWEQDRLASRGDGMQFFDLSSDFEGYFEGLRLFAGEPAAGSRGRILPKYDPKWIALFSEVVVKARVGWWDRERRRAEEQIRALEEDRRVGLEDSGSQPVRVRL